MKEVDFNELRDRAYDIAVRHGWHEEEKPLEHWLCLINGELSEAVEADRKVHRADYASFEKYTDEYFCYSFEAFVKDSLEDELADTVIRILDLSAVKKYDLSAVNINTKIHHFIGGRKLSFTIKVFQLQSWIVRFFYNPGEYILKVLIESLFELANNLEIDLLRSVELKMKYNEYRPYKHGKQY